MFNKSIDLIKNAKKIAVFTHITPDGDALGSSIALKLGIQQLDKHVDVFCADEIHENYNFLDTQKHFTGNKESNYDLAIAVDCPEISRIGNYSTLFNNISKRLVIDHHLNNNINANASIIDEQAGSAGIVVYRLLTKLNININNKIATGIYTAIASDTGCFMYNSTTSESHRVAADLIEKDIDLETINFYLFKRKTKPQIALFARALNNLQFHEDNKIAIIALDQNDLKQTNTKNEDTIGISHYISGIDKIDVAILLTETKNNCYLVSFRSSTVNTSLIARQFKGGGHANASGCRICGKKENVIDKLIEACKKEL
jgi:phosphoesterase RecJ-like protein